MSKSMSTPRQCFRPGKPSTQSCAENTEKGSPAACGSTRPGELLFVLDGLAGQGLHKNRMEMDGNYRWKGVDSYILIVVVLECVLNSTTLHPFTVKTLAEDMNDWVAYGCIMCSIPDFCGVFYSRPHHIMLHLYYVLVLPIYLHGMDILLTVHGNRNDSLI